MEKFNRAERRFQTQRLKQKRKTYWFSDSSNMTPKHLGMVAQTPQRCSCSGCGNARRNPWNRGLNERTPQEIIHIATHREEDDMWPRS